MLVLYRIYQIFIMIPLLAVTTILAATITIIGSMLGAQRSMGYWPGHIWARIFSVLSLVKVNVRGRENINADTSYVFVANHQGAYDIFAIYGYLGHNFRWMMKKGLEKIPFVGYSCRVSAIYLSIIPHPLLQHRRWRPPRSSSRGVCRLWSFRRVLAAATARCMRSAAEHSSLQPSSRCLLCLLQSTGHTE